MTKPGIDQSGQNTPQPNLESRQRIARCPRAVEVTGLSRSSLYAMRDPKSRQFDPTFPKPIKLGRRAVGWRENDLIDWLNSREQVA